MASNQFATLATLVLLFLGVAQSYTYGYGYGTNNKQSTRKITIKQGVLQGVVVEPKVNHALSPTEMYLGIPYAAPPVGDLRFMPPGSAPSWFGVKFADSLMPVCPQKLPNMNNMEASRKEYFSKLVQHLLNQSEDCLYLNIYAPLQDGSRPHSKKYPVMVFVHGESFEWNSGNPYDGSVLAAHGDVIVVTLNYRLGILGFLKVGLEETASSNFGLVDQVAALLWVQENIAAFGGDPNHVTLFGHGTGAACISLLMLSPMVAREDKPLFKRAILMSGTALADWALAATSRQVTYQVAEALNCPTDAVELATCLRKKRLQEIMEVGASTRDYMTRFGPVVDGRVIPNDPEQIMSTYNDFFNRFEMMYGVTEIESVHLLEPVGLTYGLLEKERDQELRKYLYTRCEYKPELYVAHTLAMYAEDGGYGDGVVKEELTGHEPDRASVARDVLLDMLSDARSAAPLALTARYHAAINPQSYFYVFGHTTASREFIRNKTSHGEELPYVFGVPLDGPKYHFTDHYNNQERLLSEFVMSLWCNFAHTGNPNGGRNTFLTLHPTDWKRYDIDWPEFDGKNERYLYLGIPPEVRQHYRSKEIHYWNDILPVLLKNRSSVQFFVTKPPHHRQTDFPFVTRTPPKNLPPWFPFGKGTSSEKHRNVPERKPNDVAYGTIKLKPDDGVPSTTRRNEYGTVVTKEPQVKGGGTAMIVLIAVGAVFLLINVVLFVGLYYKCTRYKSRESRSYVDPVESQNEHQVKEDEEEYAETGCSIMKMIGRSSKSEDTYEAVKVSDDGSNRYKLSRQMSASTIDPHTKVRDWIAHEIVQRCSPKFVRRPKVEIPIEQIKVKSSSLDSARSKTTQSYSTLGKSPTRPVSPADGCGSLIPKMKAQKVSVAVDATPAARSPSVLRQQPIELTKSLDYSTNYPKESAPMRRSNTVDNILDASDFKQNVDLDDAPTIVKIEHHHVKSRSDPVEGIVYARTAKKMTTFDPQGGDVNVTSREEDDEIAPLSAEESLMTIKRRNFPKVLPDYPDKQYVSYKRRSMPVQSPPFMPIPENSTFAPGPKGQVKTPPAPPPRSTSSLGRKCAVKMAEEPPPEAEPEITCNNLVIGPLLPRKVDPIYDNLEQPTKIEKQPKTVVTADPNNPIRKNDAKVIIKPTITRNTLDRRNNTIPRVTAKDTTSERPPNDENSEVLPGEDLKKSQIPVLVKSTNKESSSESSPSDESETGTVIKRV